MLFQVVEYSYHRNVSGSESSEAAKRSGEWWLARKKTKGVKVLTGTDPHWTIRTTLRWKPMILRLWHEH